MMKYLLVLLVVIVAIGIWRSNRRNNAASGNARSSTTQGNGALPRTQAMVTCAHCGLHLPQTDAQAQGTHAPAYYCSDEHRRLGPR